MWVRSGCRLGLCLSAFHRVHWCRCAGSRGYFADVSKIGQDSARCSAFCPLPRFAHDTLRLNMALFRILRAFLEGFTVQMYVCMGWVLCVDCVAFVRVNS